MYHTSKTDNDARQASAAQDSQLKPHLSADEQRASEVLDGMLDGYVALDRQWRCLYINRRGSQTLGLSPEELVGTDIRTLMPHWAETGFDERVRQVMDGGEPFSCEEWCPISEKWFEVRCGRSLGGLSIFFFDISARKAAETERLRAERKLQETKDQLELAVRCTKLGIWDWDLRTNELQWSPLCKAIFGFSAKTRVDYGRFLTHVHPDDRASVQDTVARCLDPAIRQDYDLQFRTGLPDKTIRWVLARGRPYFEGDTPVRFIGTALDITGEKAVEEQLRLLVNELSHRVKNTLAVIQTIADRTLSGNGPIEPMREAFIGRLHALAETHSLLTSSKWECVDLGALVHESLGHMASCENARVRATGTPVSLAAKASLAMGMTLHELGTNAAKYGALSVEGGEVDIRWEVLGEALVLEWNECGLAGVAPPTRQGFGSKLIKQAVQYDLGGVIHQEFRPSGLQCRLTIPTQSALAR